MTIRSFLFLCLLLAAGAGAEDPDANLLKKYGVKIARLPDGRVQLENVIIDPAGRSVELHGLVNMQDGLVELFACTPAGKVHESVLSVDVRPLHLQLALLMLGLEPGRNPGAAEEADDKRKPGDMVEIRVSWEAGGVKKTVSAEEMIANQPQKRTMRKTGWVFLGSQMWNGVFAADETGSLITTYRDPTAIIENPLDTVNDDTLYFSNREVVPPVGTKATITIIAAKRKN